MEGIDDIGLTKRTASLVQEKPIGAGEHVIEVRTKRQNVGSAIVEHVQSLGEQTSDAINTAAGMVQKGKEILTDAAQGANQVLDTVQQTAKTIENALGLKLLREPHKVTKSIQKKITETKSNTAHKADIQGTSARTYEGDEYAKIPRLPPNTSLSHEESRKTSRGRTRQKTISSTRWMSTKSHTSYQRALQSAKQRDNRRFTSQSFQRLPNADAANDTLWAYGNFEL